MAAPAPPRQDSPLSLRTAALHVYTLCAFAFAQPLFDILARHAVFFVVRRSEPVDAVLLAVALIAIVPLPLIALEALAQRLGVLERVHLVLVALLFAFVLLPPFSRVLRFDGWGIVAAALLAGGLAAALYRRLPLFPSVVTVASVALVVFPALFLFDAAVRNAVYPRDRIAIRAADVQGATPVIMVVFDAFPLSALLDAEQRIDAEMFPNFATLADGSVWFRNATAVSEHTIYAVPAILTGRYPQPTLHPTVDDHPGNLFTLLASTYTIRSIEVLTRLNPTDATPPDPLPVRLGTLLSDLRVIYLHVLVPEDLTRRLPPISDSWGNFAAAAGDTTAAGKRTPASQRSQEFRDFVATMNADEPRTLWFLHSVLPHSPHVHYPSGRPYSPREPASGQGNQWGLWSADEWAADQGYQRFLLQVSLVDNLVGELMARLRATGLWDDAILVVTADHGAAYRAGDEHRGLTETNFADIMAVPLFVRAPGLDTGTISDANVQAIDILPTIAALLGVSPTWSLDGTSAFDPALAERQEKICYRDKAFRFPADAMQARSATVAHKSALFGDTGTDRWYRLGPHGDLVGRPVSSFRVAREPAIAARLRDPAVFENVRLDAGILPGEIVGIVERKPGAASPWIAVAVNGVIRSVTRPFAGDDRRDAALWAAIVAEESFRPGRNDVALYSVDAAGTAAVGLRSVAPYEGRPQLIGVKLGGQPVWGVGEAGFHAQGWAGEMPFRWTTGNGRLVVPIDPAEPPRELFVELFMTGPEPTHLEIKVNDVSLFAGTVPREAWSVALSLDDVPLGRQVTIDLVSDTFVPAETIPGNMDARTLGVGVRGVTLR